jgi:hypothetical protein
MFQQLPMQSKSKQNLETLLQEILSKQFDQQSPQNLDYQKRVRELMRALNDEDISLFDLLEYNCPMTTHKDPKTNKFSRLGTAFDINILALVKDLKVKNLLVHDCFDEVEAKLNLELKHSVYDFKPLSHFSPAFHRVLQHLALTQQISIDMLKRILYALEDIICKHAPMDVAVVIAQVFSVLKQTYHMASLHLPKKQLIQTVDKLEDHFGQIRAKSIGHSLVAKNNPILSTGIQHSRRYRENKAKAQIELKNFISQKCPMCGHSKTPKKPTP